MESEVLPGDPGLRRGFKPTNYIQNWVHMHIFPKETVNRSHQIFSRIYHSKKIKSQKRGELLLSHCFSYREMQPVYTGVIDEVHLHVVRFSGLSFFSFWPH